MIKKLILWILVIFCMGTIFMFSSQEAEVSNKTSSVVVKKIIRTVDIHKKLSEKEVESFSEKIMTLARKAAHFSIYSLLGFLVFLLIYQYYRGKKPFYFSIGLCFLYACSDEYHQTFVRGRSGEFRDVLIDTSGALVGIVLSILVVFIITKIMKGCAEK